MSRVGRYKSGFTIVELVVVIVIIGILAGIVTAGLNRYTTNARDTQRQAKATVISEALEKYYSQNGEYPGCSQISNTANVSGSTLTGLTGALTGVDQNSVLTPTATSSTTNSISCTDLTSVTGSDVFAYVGDGSSTCNATTGTTSCLSYTLKYKDETTGQIDTITSRHTTQGTTSGDTSLSIGTPSFTTDALSWTAVNNATGYDMQTSTTTSFSGATAIPLGNVTSYSVTGLTAGSTHYYQVRPTFVSGQAGNWSNTVHDTTWVLTAPTLTAGTAGLNSLSYSWGTVSHADSYSYQLSSDSGFGTIVDSGTTNGLTHTTSSLQVGKNYWIQVRATATASPTPGAYSAPLQMMTVLPAPVCNSTGVPSNTQITTNWSTSTGATSYNIQYGPGNYGSQITGATGTSYTIGGLNNGTNYTSRIQAAAGSTTSAWTNCPDGATGVDGPSGYGWYADGYGVRNSAGLPWMPGAYPGAGNYYTEGMTIYTSCGAGATPITRLYSWYTTTSGAGSYQATLDDWSVGNKDRYVPGGKSGYRVWWQGWVGCQVGGNVPQVFFGSAGPYS